MIMINPRYMSYISIIEVDRWACLEGLLQLVAYSFDIFGYPTVFYVFGYPTDWHRRMSYRLIPTGILPKMTLTSVLQFLISSDILQKIDTLCILQIDTDEYPTDIFRYPHFNDRNIKEKKVKVKYMLCYV